MTTPADPGHLDGQIVAVTGATGNLGTALLRQLFLTGVHQVRGLSRREPPDTAPYSSVFWTHADLGDPGSAGPLREFCDRATTVVHLAWALQPGREPDRLAQVNVDGTRRVLSAAADAGVGHVVVMSSLGSYAPGNPADRVDETWPTTGVPSSQYSRDKVAVEQVTREFADAHPDVAVTVVRPTLVLQPDAASEIGRYFLGPLLLRGARALPGAVASKLPLPLPDDLHLGFVHADDVADALLRTIDRRATGAFNLSADPVLDPDGFATTLGSKRVPVPRSVLRAGLVAAFESRLVPTEPGWLDLALDVPALDTTRAREVLEWSPRHPGDRLLADFVTALGRGDGGQGPLLHP
ncbi:NAD-dependent epimerase/dehydratase family protein [Klenkia sp. PcliD-1-E]|uniref:NAD-dependent epimerase/dehydratase family protein n=1 Tax=Klenkia sp. PcliD-1-E TaxID=2954492 RepID=UPI0020979C72|nr:NAD-dependent epimerase/dehydratase family protein [Klenkia sp. PcliD-1-E]MCO7220771.1 NAD-dependent epimerase/dehydratase family protein [Klenkia sp. PcliD-1-E]